MNTRIDIAGDIGNQKMHKNATFTIVPHEGSKTLVVYKCSACGYNNIRHISHPWPQQCAQQWAQVN
jgi:C4-type Zn-finger protein